MALASPAPFSGSAGDQRIYIRLIPSLGAVIGHPRVLGQEALEKACFPSEALSVRKALS